MSAELLTKFLQQKYTLLNETPFNIVNVVINVPGDELVNDVTIYLDKESATTIESLPELELVRFGHGLLEDVFLQLAAPPQCSLHLTYQFFDDVAKAYKDDETYYVGDWWEEQQGFWIARVYLNVVYDEQAKDKLLYDSWINGRRRYYRPEQSKLLYFANANQFKQFWDSILQIPSYANLPVKAVTVDELGHKYQRLEIVLTSAGGDGLKQDEYTAIVLGWRFFMYAQRFYDGRMRKVWLKITAGEETLVSFESHNKHCQYRSWLDEEWTEFKLKGPPVFNGRAKRELKKYLKRRFQTFWRLGRLQVYSVRVYEKNGYQVSLSVGNVFWFYFNKRGIESLLLRTEKLVWDVYNYYERPRRCTLKLYHGDGWHLLVRLDEIDGGYRLIRQTSARNYEPVFFDDGGILAKLSEPFQKDWDQYRYVYRPVNEVEA